MLSLDKIKEMSQFKTCVIEVPLLDESVRVRLFKRDEIDAMRAEATVSGRVREPEFQKLLLMRGLIEPALTDAEYDALAGGNGAVYYALLNAVMEGAGLNALGKRDDTRRTFSA